MTTRTRFTATRRPIAPLLPAAMLVLLAAAMAGCSGATPQATTAPLPGDALGSSAGEPATPTADAAVRKTPVVPGRRARVFIFAAIGDNCEPLPAPKLTVTSQPGKGDLSFVPGQETTIKTSGKGTCIGQQAKGTGLYYTARSGQRGIDRFSVTATLADGETATRNFQVRIAD